MLPYLTALFVLCLILTVKQSVALAACVLKFEGDIFINFFEEKSASGDLA